MDNEILYPGEELRHIQQNCLQELRQAHNAYATRTENTTSFPFVVNQIPSSPLMQECELFQALIIGGTVGRKALCSQTKEGIKILEQEDEGNLPYFTQKEVFFDFLDGMLDQKASAVSMNLAYPLKPVFEDGMLDGILLPTHGKALSVKDLIGARIGKEFEQYIQEKRRKTIKVSVGNDTICLLLSGKTKFQEDNLACGVVGTGINFGFLLDRNKAVNLESANFNKFTQSKIGKLLTEELGISVPFAKETDGISLYRHFNYFLEKSGINFPHLTSTKQLSELSLGTIPQNTMVNKAIQQEVLRDLSRIAKDILARSAMLVASQIAGITEFKQRDMVFVMEGSLFWKGNGYKETVEQTIQQLTPRKVTFIQIPNSGILGASKLIA